MEQVMTTKTTTTCSRCSGSGFVPSAVSVGWTRPTMERCPVCKGQRALNDLVEIMSFGWKHGGPPVTGDPCALVIDVRTICRRNPHRKVQLRRLTGLDPEVARDIEGAPSFAEGLEILKRRIATVAGLAHARVYLGCTGGRHRSVYFADRLGRELGVSVRHRDMARRP